MRHHPLVTVRRLDPRDVTAAAATAEGLKPVNPRLIQANSADNVTFSRVKLVDAAKQHPFISKSTGATVWGIEIATADDTDNTDGVDVDSGTDVTCPSPASPSAGGTATAGTAR